MQSRNGPVSIDFACPRSRELSGAGVPDGDVAGRRYRNSVRACCKGPPSRSSAPCLPKMPAGSLSPRFLAAGARFGGWQQSTAQNFDEWLRQTRSRLRLRLRAANAVAVPGLAPIVEATELASENGKCRGLRIPPALIRFANVGKTGLNVDLLASARRAQLR